MHRWLFAFGLFFVCLFHKDISHDVKYKITDAEKPLCKTGDKISHEKGLTPTLKVDLKTIRQQDESPTTMKNVNKTTIEGKSNYNIIEVWFLFVCVIRNCTQTV